MGQKAAEQRRPLARAVGQNLRHQAAVVVVDDRLRHSPEEGEGMDMAVHPRFGHRRRIGVNIARIAVRQIEHEEVRLLLHAADHHSRLAEIGLRMAWRMRQRHEHLLAAPRPVAHVVLDDRVAAGKPMFVTKAIKNALGRMTLLARDRTVRLKPLIDDRDERVQLRASHRSLPPIAGRNRIRHHLANRVARYAKMPCCLALAHAPVASHANLQI